MVQAVTNPDGNLVGCVTDLEHRLRTEQSNILTVPANFSFDEYIHRGGCRYVCPEFAEGSLPVTADQIGKWEWKLFIYDRKVSTRVAIRLMRQDGYSAGQIGHMLAFGEMCPEEQCKDLFILAPGSVDKNGPGRHFPLLSHYGGRRELGFGCFYGYWGGNKFLFLGVRDCLGA